MSTGMSIDIDRAQKLAQHLANATGAVLNPPATERPDGRVLLWTVGSVRRGCPMVGDLEFLAPCREYAMGPDPVAEWVAKHFEPVKVREKRVVEKLPRPERVLGVLKLGGREADWKLARLSVQIAGQPFQVEIHRFEPGDDGNRGWTELRATGCADFGKAMLTLLKRRKGIGESGKGSIDGYLVNKDGHRIPQATEQQVFEAVEWKPLAPTERDDKAARDVMYAANRYGAMR